MFKLSSLLYLILMLTLLSCASRGPMTFEDDEETQTVFDRELEKLGKFRIQKEEEKQDEAQEESSKDKVSVEKKKSVKQEENSKDQKKQRTQKSSLKNDTKEKKVVQKSEAPSKEEERDEDQIYPEEFDEYDKKSQRLWELYRPVYFPGEEFVFAIKYLGITAAHIRLSINSKKEIAGRQAFHYKAQLKSARFYRSIYKMEDTVETYVDAKTYLPLRYSLVQRETGQDVDDLQVFDSEELKTYFWYKRDKDNQIKEEEKESYIPQYFQDTFSAMFFVRGLPLEIGDVYEFPIMTRAKLWLVKMKVESVEEIKVLGKWEKAYKIEAETRFPTELSDEKKKKGKINFWVSANDKKKILSFSASVRFGSIYGELTDYKEGKKE